MRQPIQLTKEEEAKLATFVGTPRMQEAPHVWDFWKLVAFKRGLDYSTIISRNGKITALPMGHGEDWCYPESIKCQHKVKH